MLFNSWQFALFFPLVTALYFALPHRVRWAWLLLASCVFYMAFVPVFTLILAFTITVDYFAGLAIDRARGRSRLYWLYASIAANLGVLAFFKYFNFFNENLASLASLLHWNYPIEALAILLPVGLSFHVFQSLSYTIEVYRGRQAPERHLGILAVYVMFYPQLVAGPIERPQNLLPQFHQVHAFDAQDVAEGLRRMAWGLFKKAVIADRIALLVLPVFAHPAQYSSVTLLAAAVLFAFQIYCDFSGYSDIAIGSARVMGFRLMENFRQPYAARSIAEFWTRWHISLSTWFKDYLYIPLGGNRVAGALWARNILAVFLLSGLWHGANWTFIVWGALHALYMLLATWTQHARARVWALVGPAGLRHALQTLATFSLVTLAWIFFRSPTLAEAWTYTTRLVSGLPSQLMQPETLLAGLQALDPTGAQLVIVGLAIGLMELVHRVQRDAAMRARLEQQSRWVRWPAYQALVWAIVLLGTFENQAFIYFQF